VSKSLGFFFGFCDIEQKTCPNANYDHDGIADLMVKFDRSAVEGLLNSGEKRLWITSQVTGLLLGCGGWDSIAVMG